MKCRVLHLGFHNGCTNDVKYICDMNGFDFHHMRFDDGITQGNKIYNVSSEIADNAWKKYKDYYNSFDLIITSDTAPISRVFLQNDFKKPLLIWVCNRFDYFDNDTYDGSFPDPKYYELIKNCNSKNIKISPYTFFEKVYAKIKGVDQNFGDILLPFGSKTLGVKHLDESRGNPIPVGTKKEEYFFIPPYRNDTEIINLSTTLNNLNIKNCNTRYGSPLELKDFRGIVHIPYAWSNLALFENLNLGIPYLIPSLEFWIKLNNDRLPYGLFFSNPKMLDLLRYSEWYSDYNKSNFIFFDSWEHLEYINKKENDFFLEKREIILNNSQNRITKNLAKWNKTFRELLYND